MMRPGLILAEPMLQQIQATPEQRSSLTALQATVDSELAKILSPEQLRSLQQMGRGQTGFGPTMGAPHPKGKIWKVREDVALEVLVLRGEVETHQGEMGIDLDAISSTSQRIDQAAKSPQSIQFSTKSTD